MVKGIEECFATLKIGTMERGATNYFHDGTTVEIDLLMHISEESEKDGIEMLIDMVKALPLPIGSTLKCRLRKAGVPDVFLDDIG